MLADKGYYKAEDLKKCVEKNITPYVTKQTYSNGTGDRDFYTDRFIYDKVRNLYLCPVGKALFFWRNRNTREKGLVGYDYRNFEACQSCQYKERCTKSQKGRSIFRHVDQDFLDTIDLKKYAGRFFRFPWRTHPAWTELRSRLFVSHYFISMHLHLM